MLPSANRAKGEEEADGARRDATASEFIALYAVEPESAQARGALPEQGAVGRNMPFERMRRITGYLVWARWAVLTMPSARKSVAG